MVGERLIGEWGGTGDERRGTKEGEGAMGNLEYRILNDEGDLRRNRRLNIWIRA